MNTNTPFRRASLTAGLALLLMAVLAPFAEFYVIPELIDLADPAATAAALTVEDGLFRAGVLSYLIVVVLDVIVAWGLYLVLKPVNSRLSLLAAWFRLVYSALFAAAILELTKVLPLLEGTPPANLGEEIISLVNSFRIGWQAALIFFSFHLLILGLLLFRSGFFPRFLGILVVIAGLGYLIDGIGNILVPSYSADIAVYTFIGELLLIFWLIWKGLGKGRLPE